MNISDRTKFCKTLKMRASWTNKVIGQGLSTRMGVLEETITDMNLLQVAIDHEHNVLTKKFSRRKEGSLSGADWLWCIGEPGAWLNLLVQAKVVNPVTGACHYLNYNNGKQRSLLLQYARRIKAVPIYAIYSYIPNGYEPPPKARPEFSNLGHWEWGCSWLTPRRIRQLVNSKQRKLEHVLQYAIPWSYPFCQKIDNDNQLLGQIVAEGLAKGQDELSDRFLVPAKMESDSKDGNQKKKKGRTIWESVDPRELIHDEFPLAVKKLLAQKSYSQSAVPNISVISATPLEESLEPRFLIHKENTDSFYTPLNLQEFDRVRYEKKQ